MDLLNWKDFGFKMILPIKQLSQNMRIKDCETKMICTTITPQSYYIILYSTSIIDQLLCTWIFLNARKDGTEDTYIDVLSR